MKKYAFLIVLCLAVPAFAGPRERALAAIALVNANTSACEAACPCGLDCVCPAGVCPACPVVKPKPASPTPDGDGWQWSEKDKCWWRYTPQTTWQPATSPSGRQGAGWLLRPMNVQGFQAGAVCAGGG